MGPAPWSWLIRVAAFLAPPATRAEWLGRWNRRLASLWILRERGELGGDAVIDLAWLCRSAFRDALELRTGKQSLQGWLEGPGFLLTAAGTALAILGVLSHGFAKTRSVIATIQDLFQHPVPGLAYDHRGDVFVAYTVPIAMALATAAVMVVGRLSVHRHSWRYWSFLAAKAAAAMRVLSLLWIEGGAAVRARIHNEMLFALGGCLALALIFIGVFGWVAVWILTDQRRRCPVCLRRLAMPVTLGSWASVLEPPATELLCAQGHGSLCMAENDLGEADRWTALDSSWNLRWRWRLSAQLEGDPAFARGAGAVRRCRQRDAAGADQGDPEGEGRSVVLRRHRHLCAFVA